MKHGTAARLLPAALLAGGLALGTVPAASAAPADGGAVLQGGAFDQASDLGAWTVTGPDGAARISDGARTGAGALEVGWTTDADVTVSQVFHGVAPGAYTATAYVLTQGVESASLALGDETWRRTGFPQEQQSWLPVVVEGVPSSTGQLEISFELSGVAGQSVLVDDVTLVPDAEAADFFRGGDLTFLTQIEDAGGRYYDAEGNPVDPVQYMADQGVNLARLRVYNGTGPEHHRVGDPDSYLPAGYQDPDDILTLARRAHDAGMAIQLTFHYSDYWSNAEIQDIPLDWRDEITALDPTWMDATDPHGVEYGDWDPDGPGAVAAADRLEELVHEFTADFLQRMNAQGTPPAFVALGNETGGGLLLPYGRTWQFDGGNWPDLVRFYNAGSSAVRETTPDARVIIHLDAAGDDGKYTWYHDELTDRGVDYDVIGSSYYPWWVKQEPAPIADFFQRVHDAYGKPVMVMETAVNWTPLTHEDKLGQLNDNGGTTFPQTKTGQLNFARESFARFKALDSDVVLGDIWWDPMMIPVDGVGWQVGGDNVVSNSTIWDFDGRALPVFRAFAENASSPRQAVAAPAAPSSPAAPAATARDQEDPVGDGSASVAGGVSAGTGRTSDAAAATSGALARTGAAPMAPALLAIAMVSAGTAAVAAARRGVRRRG